MDSGSGKKTIFAAIGANLAIAITKFIAAAITGSSAMLSEGIHSTVDTTNANEIAQKVPAFAAIRLMVIPV